MHRPRRIAHLRSLCNETVHDGDQHYVAPYFMGKITVKSCVIKHNKHLKLSIGSDAL